ncbi:N-acetylated-alpha-linked acidic dipeptidase [Lineolata rhizophorae]|uniref:N-acetylated-alpha-linked acidic dipeptidase n=1 Tax=Lineolata rhizophorae TaxID=578093 RepID=A0A6A6P336_9PEZI|nr:N-acetylated-alpha-linked acidic dipeptidase [Lineolata rhizophorae]
MARFGLFLAATALALNGVDACQREHLTRRHVDGHTLKPRQTVDFPPVLTDAEAILVNSFDNNSISDWSYYYTHDDHVAGRNRGMAQWTADRWSENGIPSSLATYNVYLNYPVSHSLSLTYPNGSTFTASLEEAQLPEDPTTTWDNRIPTFHGYSKTGNATAEYVYVGRGQQVDFERLVELGVDLEGKIALAMYGGAFRGLKVKNAEAYGMIGAVLFSDPGDSGNLTIENGYAPYPDGPAMNPTYVQRGSVEFLSTYPGDPTTPGYPSKADSPRTDGSEVLPGIPSLPISYTEALPLLSALDGYGFTGEQVNRSNWIGALNVTYSTGPAPGAVISMSNVMEDATTDIWDAIGIINGTNSDETIVVGNHRDAWIIGGAADPNSGSAVLVEMSKALGRLLQVGWQPKRNIVLCSWDGEEYGLIGSTEWVEEYIPWLVETAVSYLNVDIACSGPRPEFAASPEMYSIATELMKKVIYPSGTTYTNGGVLNTTLYDAWYEETEGDLSVLGSGSDYTAFLHNGIGSIDIGAGGGALDPFYHYHSNYDSYHWMSTFGDPEFTVHKAIGQYLALLTYHMASDDLIPADLQNYAEQMHNFFDDLMETVEAANGTLDLGELSDAIDEFDGRVSEVKALETQAMEMADMNLLAVVNHKYRDWQRGLVSVGGLPDRQFYKHVVMAPGIDTGMWFRYAPVTYPGITEAVEAGNFDLASEWVSKTAMAIHRAADIIKT